MRKLLIAIASVVGVFSATYFALSTPAPLLTGTSGCQEASQLLNCLNSAVINLLRGNGPTGAALTSPISVGTFGTVTSANGNTNQTLNAQGGLWTITAMTLAQNANVSNAFNNSLLTAASACVASIASTNAASGSAPTISQFTPGAGNVTMFMNNGGPVTTGSANFTVAFWCLN